jgi:hypothetical protein
MTPLPLGRLDDARKRTIRAQSRLRMNERLASQTIRL